MFRRYKTKTLNSWKPKKYKCTNCGSVGTTIITIEAEVAGTLGPTSLPIAETTRGGHSKCEACGVEFNSVNMPSALMAKYSQLYVATPSNPYHYFWAIAIGLVALVGIPYGISISMKTKSMIEEPLPGDTFRIETTKQYSALRILLVTPDSLYLEKGNSTEHFKRDSTLGSVWVSRDQIRRMYHAGELGEFYRSEELMGY